jgi:hypothetical protein
MKTKNLLFVALCGLLTFNSCKKESSTPPPAKSEIAKRNLTDDEKILKLKLEQSAKIIAEVIKDKTILSELNGQIARKLKITKSEESLTFKELFTEPVNRKVESSGSSSQKTFVMDATIANHFKTSYMKIAKYKTYEHPEKYSILEQNSNRKMDMVDPVIEDMLMIDGAELYFPYSENFLDPNLSVSPDIIYTVTSNPIDNDAENEGIAWNEFTQTWEYVLVNDNYAWDRPTLIVNIDENSTNNLYPSADNPPPSTPYLDGRQVLIGEIMSTEQYGELFTGGPQFEFKIFKPGSLTTPFSIDNNFKEFRDGVQTIPKKLTRKNVRRHEWVGVYGIAHSNWVPNQEQIHIGLFEDDSQNWFANEVIKFEPKVKWKDHELSIFSLEIKPNGHDYIGEYDQDRASFFALNNTDVYLGTRTDSKGTWRIYRQGAVSYTMPVINF